MFYLHHGILNMFMNIFQMSSSPEMGAQSLSADESGGTIGGHDSTGSAFLLSPHSQDTISSRFSVPLWSASNAALSEGPFKVRGKRVLSKIYLSLGDLKYTSESSSISSPLCWSSIISFLRKAWGSVQGDATWKLIHTHIDGTHHGIQTYIGPPTNKNVCLQNKYMWQ